MQKKKSHWFFFQFSSDILYKALASGALALVLTVWKLMPRELLKKKNPANCVLISDFLRSLQAISQIPE